MPFNLGPWEILIIFLIALLAFGAKRLPEVGAAMGKSIREFKRNIKDVKDSLDESPTKNGADKQIGSYEDDEPRKLSE